MKAPLSLQQRRLLERHAHGVDLVTASDQRWFEEQPHREFRIRRMAASEIGSATAIGALKSVPEGAARFTLVRKIGPDCRMRIFIFGSKHKTGNEASEAIASALWSHYLDRNPAARERKLAIKANVSDHDLQGRAGRGGAG